MGRNRPSNEDAPRVPGEERSGRRPMVWIVLGLILLLLLALLIPFACQAIREPTDQGSGGGSGAQGGTQKDKQNPGRDDDTAAKGDTKGDAQKSTGTKGAKGAKPAGSDGSPGEKVDVDLAAVSNRSGDGTMVTIPKAKLEGTKGWLAIHATDSGKPGAVLGHAALKEGTNRGVRVKLDRPIESSQKLYAVIHAEDPADGKWTYPDGDPPIMRDAASTVEPLYYTLKGAADGTSSEQVDLRGGGLPQSGGVPPAILLASGWIILLSSSTCILLALRRAGTYGS